MFRNIYFGLFAASLMLALAWGASVASALPARAAPAEPDARANALMQFTSSGHVLSFQRDGVHIASGDHALNIQFIGTAGVAPAAAASAETNRAAPLTQVTYANLWRGITLRYDAPDSSIARSTFQLEPFANADDIRLRYNAPIELDASGELIAQFMTGAMHESAPIAWQEINGLRIAVPAEFALRDSTVGFTVGKYDRAYPLVIDPTLIWNTFLGGSSSDKAQGIAVDGSGNVYVAGSSTAFWGASPVLTYTSGGDAFVAKLNSAGAMQWYTFLGGSGSDSGTGIAVDGSGNVYVVGSSNATWGASPVLTYTSGTDAFAAKLNSSGVLQWNTFLGGSGSDSGSGITVEGNPPPVVPVDGNAPSVTGVNVYVVGSSNASWGASPVLTYTIGNDAFVAKLNSSGVLQWNTFLGGAGTDLGTAIAVDGTGSPIGPVAGNAPSVATVSVYVAGYSNTAWGSPTARAYSSPGFDAFAAKLDSSGVLQWNSFLGGSFSAGAGQDFGSGIAVDGSGNVYVTGNSDATWQEGATPPMQAYMGQLDAFAAKLNSSGVLQWNSFLGQLGDDKGNAIAVDGSGNSYVTGYSFFTWGAPLRAFTAGNDAFAAKLSSSGVLQWNTFLGGSGNDDEGTGIALDGSRNVFVTGYSNAAWQDLVPPVRAYANGLDAFVAKVSCCFDLYLPLIMR